ncbi:agmatine coumaroyltransferase-2 isoform X2 [Jatropha curcas]|uniref:agmatine coumaroyltransferase-2 isoform X1 n=1 Tax=Jatropha curcas TaxID=180498 RepID=UPI0018952989|nr:agmatine coumaroyltransferase-2 isoform X1 [Jatropha curcas]XP_037491007.1 agmatine coumaroyltransferase-2 isoform X2 [Jatropha curcas]
MSVEEVEVHKVHFTMEFLSELKTRASNSLLNGANGNNKPYTTFESLLAHLWRTMTKARQLNGSENTRIKISVNGRARMNPKVPNEYFGNLVLWTYPSSKVEDLVQEPLGYAAKLVRNAVESVNDKYFKSFIDFATVKAKEEDLVPTADANVSTCIPNLKVDSWLRFPFYELDFGGGSPCIFMPSYIPIEGFMFLLPSCNGDGSADACITLFRKNVKTWIFSNKLSLNC